jgi:hypothetical protein
MRSSTPANPKRRRRPTSIAALLALCALAGVQAIAPASAGAVANQTTTCLNMPIPGVGLVPGMGWNGSFACVLDSGGAYYGGTDKKKDPTPTTQTQPICGRSCLPLGIGGGSGSASGPDEVVGPRPGAVTPKPKKRETAAQRDARERREWEKEKKERLAKMTPAERQKIQLACMRISLQWNKLLAREPSHQLVQYYWGKGDKKAGMETDWKYDSALEGQLPIYEKFREETARLHDAEVEAECWLLYGQPTKLPI